ncbi:unnamed protein product [Peronospora destructor]|uniref:A20-type domain-containing protein n=1 Tax=Peronospora destructor TaxID=86335 RepID=A0AAV0VEY4_9STRA|nr:unnamed protein product [Peronospora destructor]
MQQERESAELCRNGCGFFGGPGSGGMYSVCWKKTMSERQAATKTTTVTSPRSEAMTADAVAPLESIASCIETTKSNITSLEKETKPAEKPCRCGYVFCGSHRFEDQHKCSFDFKTADRAELARCNPGGGAFSKLEKL